ncbi:hypothetical protein [Tenacibaculum sp. M341]|uniref:hypothetical protein n=1 Tax=Tenacibaculum sp. M341 TaxID=2530339 RepID=UPI0010490678|nr:hypothetical protein [Tenacibaculum sp. M341]TCI95048.1 hypothetical protein EYW44_01615 [Tenacibaculum sp. M341]
MKYITAIVCILFVLVSCNLSTKDSSERFKYGTFEYSPGKGYKKTIIIRKDSLQIEYNTKTVTISTDSTVVEKEIQTIDTVFIKWKNNFSYNLRIKNPKTDFEKELINVQITKVRDSSYDFKLKRGYSKFTSKGTLYISK